MLAALENVKGEAKLILRKFIELSEPMVPLDTKAVTPLQIDIPFMMVNLRRSTNTACKIVSNVKRGRYTAYILEKISGWTLIEICRIAAWIARCLYQQTNRTARA